MLLTPDGGSDIILPNDLLWVDEHNWSPVAADGDYSLTGALIIEKSLKLAGRPITLRSPGDGLGWILRPVVLALNSAAEDPALELILQLQYPADTRSFTVMFDHSQKSPVSASPVKGFPQHDAEDYFTVTINLIEIP